MIALLVNLLIALVAAGLLVWIVSILPIPQPFKNIATAIVLLIVLVWLVSASGFPGHRVLR